MKDVAGTTLIETRQLVKSFGGVRATDTVDFILKEGELRCLIGPNGAGKSTFFKLLTGQIAPTSGNILFDGDDVTGLSSFEIPRQGIGIKNQKPDVFDGLSARENLWLAAQFDTDKKTADRRVERVVDELKLGAFVHKLVGELAHGQRQWVEIGMSMSCSGIPKCGMSTLAGRRLSDARSKKSYFRLRCPAYPARPVVAGG